MTTELKPDQMREEFEKFVREELGDIAVRDDGRYISPKINNYWRTWQAAWNRRQPAGELGRADGEGM